MLLTKLFSKSPVDITIQAGPFKGARVFLNPANSKRKIFGLYEYILNDWISIKSINKQFVMDIGANTGYDTYGFAHLLSKNGSSNPIVIAFEPEEFDELSIPRQWDIYSNCKIEIEKKFVGSVTNESTITISDAYQNYKKYINGNGIIKIDIEGSEVDALKGAGDVLEDPGNDWLIEIHGSDLIPDVADYFVRRKRPFLIKDLSPLPIIGAEKRAIFTSWLITL